MTVVAAIQMKCSQDVMDNILRADTMVREAASKGAQVILLPELFERPYFCQEKRYDYYDYATTIEENPAIQHFSKVAKELRVVMPISFYEKDGYSLYNSIVMINHLGEVMGTYRKTHIPDDHYYQEKFYFTPGDTGFKVWETIYGKIGVGICWDQWFPECARVMALMGADILLYPTAIGSEPILDCDSMPHWRRTMQGHSAANICPVVAANRIGEEEVIASAENGGQSSKLVFYGSSFLTNETGEIIQSASRDKEEILMASYDLSAIAQMKLEWGLFRDRRPSMYKKISGE